MKKYIIIAVLCLLSTFGFAQDIIPVIQSGHSGSIIYVEWDYTGRYLASADANNEIVIYDIIAGKVFFRTKFPGKELIQGMNYDNDGLLYVSSANSSMVFNPNTLLLTESDVKANQRRLDDSFKIKSSILRKGKKSLFNRNAYAKFTYAKECRNAEWVVAGDEYGCIYFCDKSLNLKETQTIHSLPINDIQFSRDGKFVACGCADRSISIWRLSNLTLEKRLIPRSFNISTIASSGDKNSFVFGDELGYAYKLTFENDKISCVAVDCHGGQVNDIQMSANPNIAVTGGSDNTATVVDFENKKVLEHFKLQNNTSKIKQAFDVNAIQKQAENDGSVVYDENVYSVAISDDGKYIAYSGGKWGLADPIMKTANISSLKIMEAKDKRSASKGLKTGVAITNNTHTFKQLLFDSENRLFGINNQDEKNVMYVPEFNGFLEHRNFNDDFFNEGCKKNPNMLVVNKRTEPSMNKAYLIMSDPNTGDKYVVMGYQITKITSNGDAVKFESHVSYINDIILLKSKNYLICSARDASLNIYDLSTGARLLSIYVVDNGKLIFVNPENYYMATGEAITGLGYYHTGRIYPAEQFDIKYNRPDYVLQSLDIFDKEIIEVYHKAYLKRIQKLGFSETSLEGELELPILTITNLNDIKMNTTEPTTRININISDENYTLDRLNVYINEVPLYGINGYPLRNLNTKTHTLSIDIPLSDGNNTIQLSCINAKGMESLKEEFQVYYDKVKKEKPNLYLISLAVADYDQSQFNLRYTINDGRGFVKLFSEQAKNFNHVYVDSLYNKNCIRENVFAVKEKLKQTNVDDYVYVHIAGHGLLDDNLDWYFATANIDFSDPAKNGLRYEEIENLLDSIPARNKLLLMDACHSGEVDKSDGAVDEKEGDGQRGVATITKTRKKTKNSLGNSFELMRLLFSDLKKGTGTVVISAASGTGYALENESIANGIFTYCLMDAFNKGKADKNKDKQVSVSELRNFIFDGVAKLSEGKQQPTSRRENLQNDFIVK